VGEAVERMRTLGISRLDQDVQKQELGTEDSIKNDIVILQAVFKVLFRLQHGYVQVFDLFEETLVDIF
jgi:hypothetical protein